MTNNITKEEIKELLEIQKKFDDRIETKNSTDTIAALIVEFNEWINTLEFFKNWKKTPGKPKDVQLDELADFVAFGLSLALTFNNPSEEMAEIFAEIIEDEEGIKFNSANYVFTLNAMTGIFTEQEVKSQDIAEVCCTPFILGSEYYTKDEIINAYKNKMGINHERQDGTADTEKGYI